MLKQLVHIVATTLQRVNGSRKLTLTSYADVSLRCLYTGRYNCDVIGITSMKAMHVIQNCVPYTYISAGLPSNSIAVMKL
jgi:hypothetical protein